MWWWLIVLWLVGCAFVRVNLWLDRREEEMTQCLRDGHVWRAVTGEGHVCTRCGKTTDI